jgi:hypothetical protein
MPPSGYGKKELYAELFENPDCFSIVFDLDQLPGTTDGNKVLICNGLTKFYQIIQEKTGKEFNSEISNEDGKLRLILRTNDENVREMLVRITEGKSEEYIVVLYSVLTPLAYSIGIVGLQNWRREIPFRLAYKKSK